jgi:hypothetical protein
MGARTEAAFQLRAGHLALLALTLVQLALFARSVADEIASSHGLLQADGVTPLGGDFINLLTAGRLAEASEPATIYLPDAFMAAEKAIIPAYIGLRLWAYPPHSLFVALPIGFTGFWPGFVMWSGLPAPTPLFNVLGLPLSPLLLLFLLAAVAWPLTTTAAGPPQATPVSPSRTPRPANTKVSP